MNSKWPILRLGLICAGLLAANGLLQFLVDNDLGIGWPHNVIRNWEEHGWTDLKGRLVTNPGGHDVLKNPEVYAGHRAASLYPAFLAGRVFAWTGSHALPFHLLSTLIVLISIWYLLGHSPLALAVAGLAILSPGYIIWPTILDPNTNSVLAGLPFGAILWAKLRRPDLTSGGIVFVLALTLVFSWLNWTTALVHAQIFVGLWAVRKLSWRMLLFYALSAGLAAIVIVAAGVASKLSNAPREPGLFLKLLAGYTWGQGGYGVSGSTSVLLTRVAFINALALFPFWTVWAWLWTRFAWVHRGQAMRALAPLAVAACEVVTLRNYFCHHPWMAAPVFLLGAVLSLLVVCSIEQTPVERPAKALSRPQAAALKLARPAAWAGAFLFSLAVLVTYRTHQTRLLALISMVRGCTARSDVIAFPAGLEASSGEVEKRWPELLDRQVLRLDQLPDARQPAPAAYLVSDAPLGVGWTLVGSTGNSGKNSPLVDPLLEWFMKRIARRRTGDRMELAESYYLYRLPAGRQAAALPSNEAPSSPAPRP
ncbi:MAG TPA: hypothetical protein VN794_20360 [Methylomirabilota bacterium]|nr:hypothetical protein [Methylomirabilota bacterium]